MRKISFLLLFTFIITTFAVFMPKVEAATFKVQITSSKLAIRSGPSTKNKIVGYYTKGQVVDILGQAGVFYKTSKGYIHSGYTKKIQVVQNTISRGAQFVPFKVEITASKLTIRSTASTLSKALGYYLKGQTVDVLGQAGVFYKTNKGYIHSAYTKRIQLMPNVNNTGKYIVIKEDTPIYKSINGAADERYAVKGKTYRILEDKGDYYKIRQGALEGYVPVQNTEIINYIPKEKITLAWHYVYDKSKNERYYNTKYAESKYITKSSVDIGFDVISPTWFDMIGSAGDLNSINVLDKGDEKYVKIAHRNGYEVWALLAEFDADRAYAMFTNKTVMNRVINQVVNYALKYNLDGINIDFEGLGLKNKDGLINFTRELTNKLKAANPLIKVSIDVTKPSSSDTWSRFYDRKALADIVDYMMFMAYDEHYQTSTVAGSVGSLPWVEQGIKEILALGVSKDKLILGVPFYLRDFTVKMGENKVISSRVLSMQQAVDIIKQFGGNIYFDDVAMQDVGEYFDAEGNRHLVWLENAKSMGYRLNLINKYDLKGMAAWQLNFETQDIWDVVKQKLK
ncbi:glycosyl hydrolase family 18 protein [Thermobrachium celere]|uniref:Spore peptidoglycan hydrolase (N-acetylglucosaminidase) n=1 Tax=Thermobrachium celere DSM 8682 TaxID=941824 RepID=R7RTN6_9CLOT|nr:glycosyl hydrolase family 18 protein [Thermobrachium celere]CDF58776.1 spore peptidoglycan hydrolase (N-acetylglucosaminidase) [Thermobrachium celere DSM 8682]